ncbi:hypothetical protein CBP31_03580 [Oceanisphaera profunda]|uniref:Uncharacterized protein n=1 Tax=Oceanisphaera profunda TaxID=1416627 RepID=A0A1Y0D3A8_9GAMM|nr:hypothetical protein CBP31_03580 [Oceanisphaera profunda]
MLAVLCFRGLVINLTRSACGVMREQAFAYKGGVGFVGPVSSAKRTSARFCFMFAGLRVLNRSAWVEMRLYFYLRQAFAYTRAVKCKE